LPVFCGFEESSYGKVFIILDKLDKIGIEGVQNELLKADYPSEFRRKVYQYRSECDKLRYISKNYSCVITKYSGACTGRFESGD
jgi:hypothetical protein